MTTYLNVKHSPGHASEHLLYSNHGNTMKLHMRVKHITGHRSGNQLLSGEDSGDAPGNKTVQYNTLLILKKEIQLPAFEKQ